MTKGPIRALLSWVCCPKFYLFKTDLSVSAIVVKFVKKFSKNSIFKFGKNLGKFRPIYTLLIKHILKTYNFDKIRTVLDKWYNFCHQID